MRYICLALLVSNIAYFFYQYYQQYQRAGSGADPAAVSVVRQPVETTALMLLRERDPDGRQARAVDVVINNPVRQGPDSVGRNCLAVGPFDDVFAGQSILGQLAALAIRSELRAVDEVTGASDYRVMIPPAASLQDAFRKLRELKSRKVDSYVITQGPDATAISLGVFSTLAAAEKIQAERARDGHLAVIAEIPRLQREFWIFAGNAQSLSIEPSVWESLVARNPTIEQRLMVCPGAEVTERQR